MEKELVRLSKRQDELDAKFGKLHERVERLAELLVDTLETKMSKARRSAEERDPCGKGRHR